MHPIWNVDDEPGLPEAGKWFLERERQFHAGPSTRAGLFFLASAPSDTVIAGSSRQLHEAGEGKKAGEVPRQKETQFLKTPECPADGILVVDNQRNVLQVSPGFAGIWKIPPHLMELGNDRELVNFVLDQVADPEAFLEKVEQLYQSDAVDTDTIALRDSRVIERYSFPMIMDGTRIGRVWSFHNIIGKKRAEDALRESEQKFRGIFDMINDGIHIHEIAPDGTPGKFIEVNEVACRMLQYTRNEMLEHGPLDFVNGYHSRPFDEIIRELSTNGHAIFETEHMRKDGLHIPVEINTHVVSLQGRRVMVSVVRDITLRRQAEEALKEIEEQQRIILDAAQVGIVLVDATSHTVIRANPKALELIGASECDITGNVCHNFICPAEQGKCPVTDLGQEVHSSERVLLKRNGTRVPIIKTVVSTKIGNRNVLVESFLDITDRKNTENALKESEERFRMLLQDVPSVAVQGYRMDGTTHYWNKASENLYGYTAEEAVGKNLLDLIIPPEMRDGVTQAIASMAETGIPLPAAELSLMKKDGSRVAVFSSHAIVRGSSGGMEMFCIDIDLTGRKQVEEALGKANRKLNLLSSITRHDINNQLTVLQGYLTLLEMKQPDKSFSGIFTNIKTAAQRITAMIQFTREYEGVGVNAPVWHDCRTLVDTAARQARLGRVSVNNDLPPGTEVLADPLIVKVCFNLIDNAVRYGRKITTIRFFVVERDGDFVIVCEDDGDGISQKEKNQIFMRGYGRNTGLGLSLSQEILEITGITIRETGEPGKGARFEMRVPDGSYRINPGKSTGQTS
nr:PAS domain S-box protein [uncultured Methanoregula sp.]